MIIRPVYRFTTATAASVTLDAAQTRAQTALRQWFARTAPLSSSTDSSSHVLPVQAGPSTAAVAVSMQVQAEEAAAAAYVARLARENAELLRRQSGKVTPLQFLQPPTAGEAAAAAAEPSAVAAAAVEAPQPAAAAAAPAVKRSVYVFGSVGRGKSMLLDAAAREAAREATGGWSRVLRLHMSSLMKRVDEDLRRGVSVETTANGLADTYEYMFIDEVDVVDVQEAVVLPRLLEVLLLRGVKMVFTSNKRPDRLYEGGLNRHVYLPKLVQLLKQGAVLVDVDYGGEKTDYREKAGGSSGRGQYIVEEEKWRSVVGSSERGERVSWPLPKSDTRTVEMEIRNGNIVVLKFENICSEKHSETDYVHLAEWFKANKKICCVGKVLVFRKHDFDNKARLFGKLVEVMYDAQVPMVVFAEAEPRRVFQDLLDNADKLDIKGFNAKELANAAQRALSRLNQLY